VVPHGEDFVAADDFTCGAGLGKGEDIVVVLVDFGRHCFEQERSFWVVVVVSDGRVMVLRKREERRKKRRSGLQIVVCLCV
jgi:hypothetical protein